MYTCSDMSDFASSSTPTSGLAVVSPRCQGCRSHPSVFAPETISVTALSKCWPCTGRRGTTVYVLVEHLKMRGQLRLRKLCLAHRVVLHVVKAPLPVQFDSDRGAHWERGRCRVHHSATAISLHILDAGCGAILRHEHATIGRLAAACIRC